TDRGLRGRCRCPAPQGRRCRDRTPGRYRPRASLVGGMACRCVWTKGEGAVGLFDLDGHVTVVTGGNSGIGLGMAAGLAAAGAQVVIWGTNEERNKTAVAKLSGHRPVTSMTVDVGDEQQVTDAMAEGAGQYGG